MSVTLDEAVALIAEKAAKGGGGKKPFRKARRKPPPRSRPAKKAAEEGRGQEEGLTPWRGASRHRTPAAGKRAGASARQERLPAVPRRHPEVHRREPRPLGQARDRQGVLAEGRRPRLAEGPAARPAGRGPAATRSASAWSAAAPCRMSRVLEICSRDAEGGLLARPAERTEDDAPTGRRSRAARRRPGAGHRRPGARQDFPDATTEPGRPTPPAS